MRFVRQAARDLQCLSQDSLPQVVVWYLRQLRQGLGENAKQLPLLGCFCFSRGRAVITHAYAPAREAQILQLRSENKPA